MGGSRNISDDFGPNNIPATAAGPDSAIQTKSLNDANDLRSFAFQLYVSTVQKFLVFSLSLVVLFSSCAMKKVLWDEFDVSSAVPAIQNPVKAAVIPCGGVADLLDDADTLPTGAVKAAAAVPALLLAILLIPAVPANTRLFDATSSPSPTGLPVYLKLGQLLYYA